MAIATGMIAAGRVGFGFGGRRGAGLAVLASDLLATDSRRTLVAGANASTATTAGEVRGNESGEGSGRTFQGLCYRAHGEPLDVLRLERLPAVEKLAPGEVRVKVVAATVNPADVNTVQGRYPLLPSLVDGGAAVGGSEGVGVVTERGDGSEAAPGSANVGDVVVPVKANLGWWGEEIVCGAQEVQAVPLDSSDSDSVAKLATLSVCFSTAFRLLHAVPLERGDSFIQNGSTSAVGQSLIQLGKLRGISSINLVRESATEDTRRYLEALGADVVTTASEVKRDCAGLAMAAPRVGFNCVGGDLSAAVAKRLAKNGTLVTYGGMSMKPVQIPTPLSIFKGIRATGFWISGQWYPDSSREERQAMFDTLCGHVARGELQVRTTTFALDEGWQRAFTSDEAKPNHKSVLRMK